ncbi:protein kinase [Streptomyces sp. NBC_00670]|uniref:protein kinase n=1 Tax=Streptomyces sp. NBC_00670 TaxID=2975804 RepID=UPI002E32F0D6|nr:protein kinase [Streptomyces sp. NBC_00670]
MDDYAGRVLADRYRLPLPAADEDELADGRAFDTYSGQEVLIRQVPLPEVVEAEVLDADGLPDGFVARDAGGRGAGARGPGGRGATRRPADPAVRRAIEAAQAAARIPDHPRLDQVFDVFAEGGSLWVVSELVPARSLAALLADQPLTPYRAAEVASDVLTALRVLHAHGWVHRNITARTVLVCDDGRVMLTGLAVGAAEEALCGYDPVPPPDVEPGPGLGGDGGAGAPGVVPDTFRGPGTRPGVLQGPGRAGGPAVPGPGAAGAGPLVPGARSGGPGGPGVGPGMRGAVGAAGGMVSAPAEGALGAVAGGMSAADAEEARRAALEARANGAMTPQGGSGGVPAPGPRALEAGDDVRAARAGAIAAYRAGARAAARVQEEERNSRAALPAPRPANSLPPGRPESGAGAADRDGGPEAVPPQALPGQDPAHGVEQAPAPVPGQIADPYGVLGRPGAYGPGAGSAGSGPVRPGVPGGVNAYRAPGGQNPYGTGAEGPAAYGTTPDQPGAPGTAEDPNPYRTPGGRAMPGGGAASDTPAGRAGYDTQGRPAAPGAPGSPAGHGTSAGREGHGPGPQGRPSAADPARNPMGYGGSTGRAGYGPRDGSGAPGAPAGGYGASAGREGHGPQGRSPAPGSAGGPGGYGSPAGRDGYGSQGRPSASGPAGDAVEYDTSARRTAYGPQRGPAGPAGPGVPADGAEYAEYDTSAGRAAYGPPGGPAVSGRSYTAGDTPTAHWGRSAPGRAPQRGPGTALEAERARQARMALVGPVTERWAPEQAGPVHENWQLAAPIGPATDLWALGALLFRSVQGHAPYPEENTAELVQLVCAEPPAFAEECGPLRPVVESLLRQDPTERPDFEELRGWLRSLVRSAPEPEAGAHVVSAPPVDTRRLPIVRRRGELVRRRRAGLPVATRARHRGARAGRPRRLGRTLLVLILLAMAAAVAYAVVFLPKNGARDDGAGADRTGAAGEASAAPGPSEKGGGTGSGATSPDAGESPSKSADDDSQAESDGGSGVAQGFTLRKDSEGFRVAVANGWDRAPKNGSGQVVYSHGEFELIVVPGRDSTGKYGTDLLTYQREKEPETQPFRDSTWATSTGMRRVDVGGRTMAEGQFTWTDGGKELYVRNLVLLLGNRYHVVQVRGPEAERDEVTRLYEQAEQTYKATG